MKQRLTALLLAILLLLTGCKPVPNQPDLPKDPVRQDSPVRNDDPISPDVSVQPDDLAPQSSEQQAMSRDLGTIPENISKGDGWFAMANGFVYTAEYGYTYILEHDIISGKTAIIDLPKAEIKPAGIATSIMGSPAFYGSMFLLGNYIGFVDYASEKFQYQTKEGATQWSSRKIHNLSILDLNSGAYTKVPELGNHVFKVIPIKKELDKKGQTSLDNSKSDNLLAGLELYYLFGYDTFPEMAAQMEQLGMTLEEPTDPNERNRYLVNALGYMDGDTRETKVLVKGDFDGNFFVDDEYIYYFSGMYDEGTRALHRSRRDHIDFQTIDLGGDFGNCIVSYDGGFYFYSLPGKQICYYKDGQITELPIAGSAFKLWREQIIYIDNGIVNDEGYYPIKMYDKNTGEIKTLHEKSGYDFHILGEKNLGCIIRPLDRKLPHVLIDLETGEQVEISAPLS